MSVPITSVAHATPLRLTWEACRCCRDLPSYLSCDRSAEASCEECGWAARYQDVDDAPETCPECEGTGITDPTVRSHCLEWDAYYAEALPRLEALEAEIARLEAMNPAAVAGMGAFADVAHDHALERETVAF